MCLYHNATPNLNPTVSPSTAINHLPTHTNQIRELHLLYPKLLAGVPHVVEAEFRPRARVPIIYLQHVNGVCEPCRAAWLC
jgi:hypothetical protein